MSGSANNGTYGNPGAPNSPWGPGSGWGQQPGWGQPPGWDYWRGWHNAKPLWIAAVVLGFIFWWPVGLALLFFGLWSKRMAYGGCGWQRGTWQGGPPPWAAWRNFWGGGGGGRDRSPPTSGNRAFDEYRAETLRRLEDEQKEFSEFLDRLRFAKDKSEFDQFMAERRQRPSAPQEPPPAPQN